jgi:hypothetical protein
MELDADRHALQHKGTICILGLDKNLTGSPQQYAVAFNDDDVAGEMRDTLARQRPRDFGRMEISFQCKMNFCPRQNADVDYGNVAYIIQCGVMEYWSDGEIVLLQYRKFAARMK